MTKVYCEEFDCLYNEDQHCCREYIELCTKLDSPDVLECQMLKRIADLIREQQAK